MSIYNLNPRRVVWFSPNEPSNKYDIWLSRNAHLDENGEPTTDSNSQRDCDYIFKIYDCGKWNPIVGFNSTAANKIDIVEGNTLYHPAIFTGENPNDLYDAGTLGSLLSDPNFVTEQEWYNVFNSSNYNWGDIFGDTNWFGDLTWSIIQGGSGTYHLPWATTTMCGGILSDTHALTADAFKPIEVKFYPTVSAYSSKLHRLCVSASDVIEQINSYYNDNPSGQSLSIPLATTSAIGGIKSDVHSYGVTSAFKPVECKFYPNQGTWSSLHERLCINAGDVIAQIIDSLSNPDENWLFGNHGVTIGQQLGSNRIEWAIDGLGIADEGKYARSKYIPQSNRHTIEWVDLPEGTVYTQGTGITISQNEISIKTDNASTGQVLTKTANGVDWSTPSQQIQYTGTNLIEVDNSNHQIGIDMSSNPSAGNIIICDGTGRDVVAKWGAVPNPNLAIINVECGSGDLTLTNNILSVRNGSFTINNESYASDSYVLNEWTYYTVSSYKTLAITSMKLTANPVYMRFSPRTSVSNFTCVGDVIDAQGVLTDTNFYEDAFVTLQFGVAKFEKVQSIMNNP